MEPVWGQKIYQCTSFIISDSLLCLSIEVASFMRNCKMSQPAPTRTWYLLVYADTQLHDHLAGPSTSSHFKVVTARNASAPKSFDLTLRYAPIADESTQSRIVPQLCTHSHV